MINWLFTFPLNTESVFSPLGVWYIPPVSQCNSSDSAAPSPREALADAKLVILYAHGSGSSRGNRFRCEAYKVFISHLDAHVVSFDYRGFGDSTPLDEPPSVEGVVNDTRVVYNWVLSSGVPPERILLWGHSLGTSVLVHMLSNLSSAKEQPMATVLEAPFTNMAEEMPEHPMNKVFRYMPWFDYMILDPLVDNVDFNFDSLSRLPKVQCPLLILHAEDDPIVPFWLGKRLYDTAREVQPETVRNRSAFHAFPAGKGYKHNFIRRAPELPHVVRLFLNSLSVS